MLLEGSFVIIYLVKNWFQISMSRHSFSVLNFGFITLLDALPLLGGGWAALWGVVFLFPQVNFRKRIWRAGRHPWASNIFVIATPLIVLGLTLVSMIWQGIVRRELLVDITQNSHLMPSDFVWQSVRPLTVLDQTGDAILKWRDWRVELENDPAAFPTSAQLEEASVIWQRVAISYRIWALSWFFWFFVGYIFAALIAFLGVRWVWGFPSALFLQLDQDSCSGMTHHQPMPAFRLLYTKLERNFECSARATLRCGFDGRGFGKSCCQSECHQWELENSSLKVSASDLLRTREQTFEEVASLWRRLLNSLKRNIATPQENPQISDVSCYFSLYRICGIRNDGSLPFADDVQSFLDRSSRRWTEPCNRSVSISDVSEVQTSSLCVDWKDQSFLLPQSLTVSGLDG